MAAAEFGADFGGASGIGGGAGDEPCLQKKGEVLGFRELRVLGFSSKRGGPWKETNVCRISPNTLAGGRDTGFQLSGCIASLPLIRTPARQC